MKKLFLLVLYTVVLSIPFTQAQEEATDFYEPTAIREIKLGFEQDNWMNMLDSMRYYGNGLLLGTAEVDGIMYDNVGLRYRHEKSHAPGSKRNSIYIKLNYIDKDQNHEGYKTLILSNALRDPSMIREVLGYEIARKYMTAPQANFANLSINGDEIGLFINVQAVDEVFLESNFGSSDNSFFNCVANYGKNEKAPEGCKQNLYSSLEYEEKVSCYTRNFKMLSKEGWDDLIDLTKVLNTDPEKLGEILHVDRTLWMLAFNNVLVNLNSYTGQNSQNYFLYQNDRGQFTPIVFDLHLAFGSFKNVGSGSDLRLKELQRLNPYLHEGNETKPLINQLLKNDLYKKIYLSHIRTIVYDNFENDWYEKRARKLQSVINMPYFNAPEKEYAYGEFQKSLTTTIGKRSKIPGIVELMGKRAKFLKRHKDISIFPPKVEEIKVKSREKFSNETISQFDIQAKVEKRAKRVFLYYRYNADDAFQVLFMADDGQSKDEKAGDKIFGVTVVPDNGQTEIEYFILAENVAAASFSPANYMYEPYKSTLAELNK